MINFGWDLNPQQFSYNTTLSWKKKKKKPYKIPASMYEFPLSFLSDEIY